MNLYIKLNHFKKNTNRFKHICQVYTQYTYNFKPTNHLSQNRTQYISILLLDQRFFFFGPTLQGLKQKKPHTL